MDYFARRDSTYLKKPKNRTKQTRARSKQRASNVEPVSELALK